jgi:hypothetical protein
MQRSGVEAVLLQRGLQNRYVLLAVAEDDGVLDVLFLDQGPQGLALVVFLNDRELAARPAKDCADLDPRATWAGAMVWASKRL